MIPNAIEREILIEAPPEVVWRMLTEPAQITQWFSDRAEIELRPGGAGTLVFGEPPNEPSIAHLVLESVVPLQTLSFRWSHPEGADAHEGNSLRVEFTLTPDGENTRLRLVESGFQQIDWPEQRRTDTVNDHEKGWDGHLARLRECAS